MEYDNTPILEQMTGRYAFASEGMFDNELQDLMDGDDRKFADDVIPDALPILPVRNTVLFPGVVIPITVARDRSIQLVKEAYKTNEKLIGVLAQKDALIENPETDNLHNVGTIAAILRLIKMPDGSITIVIQGRSRFEVEGWVQQKPYFKAQVTRLEEVYPGKDQTRAMMMSLKQEASRIIELSPKIPSEANITLQNINSLSFLIHFIASNLNLEVNLKQDILEIPTLMDKGKQVLEYLNKELQVLELSEEIQSKVRTDMDKQQRDYILRQQLRAIQDELGELGTDSDGEELQKRADKKKWPQHVRDAFAKEKAKLMRQNPSSPEHGVSLNYIEWLLDLPWDEFTKDSINLRLARKVLEDDHYGLEKVKERILEYLAVLKLKGQMKAPILCFVGPPGVGKTSLGRSIARALNRNFVRVSLGGVRDEAEIRGHRRTYIGSMPGRILQGIKKAKSGNPVFMLDEIDKVGNDYRGDPSSALLEVLDPEQNHAFNDHYLELDYNLQPLLFIATANTLDTIHPALRDRMEIIEISGYTMEEKLQIARTYLLPKACTDNGLREPQVKMSDELIKTIIEGYTRESGVRNLSQKLAAICRGVAKEIVEGKKKNPRAALDAASVKKFLGPARFENELYQKLDTPGVAIGLAWTAVGGEILFLETALLKGTGKLTLTGQLGDVMKESAQVAHLYLKAHCEEFDIPAEVLNQWDIHLHIPEGATPKDGPSAGITMLTAMASAFGQKLVKGKLAMTGEITLRGKVLPVGGIKEKVLAAVRAGITNIILCKDNQKDVEEIKSEHVRGIKFHYVTHMHQVLQLALEKSKVKNPLKLEVIKAAPLPTTGSLPVQPYMS